VPAVLLASLTLADGPPGAGSPRRTLSSSLTKVVRCPLSTHWTKYPGSRVTVLQKATNQGTRLYNLQLVLKVIYDRSPTSRADVARATGLTRTTVSEVVGQLRRSGLVEEVGPGRSTGGKAPILLRMPDDARHLIGLEVGDNRVSGAIVDLRGNFAHEAHMPLDGRDGDQALARVEALLDQLVAANERPLLGIGLGTPGLIDTATGTVRWAINLDWRDLPLGERLQERFGVPVYVVNDSQAAALAELTFGRHGARSMLVVKVGQGIGAGLVLDGRLFQGDRSGAGEIGHTAVADNHRPCRCGSTGCLETVASSRAVVQRARELAPHAPDSVLHQPPEPDGITFARLVTAFDAGDGLAREVVLDAGHHLGRTVGALVGSLDISHVVLVGAMTMFGEPWLAAVRREAHRSALTLLADGVTIEIGRLQPNIVVLGSAALLMSRELGLSPVA
jgi:predicted NBD/HSP70 family sugar kinase